MAITKKRFLGAFDAAGDTSRTDTIEPVGILCASRGELAASARLSAKCKRRHLCIKMKEPIVDQPHDPRAVVLRPPRALIFLRHVAAFFSPFGILRARIVFSYIRRRLDQDRLTEKFLIC